VTRGLICAAALALVLAAAAAQPAGAIVGGTPASRSQFPYFAVVGTGCGGALVTSTRVLTAAHCREVVDQLPQVRIGPRNELRRVRLIALAPVYVRWQKTALREFPPGPGDLMLIELDRPGTDVAPVRLARSLPRAGTRVVTIGRGATNPTTGGGQGVFRRGTVAVVANATCTDQLPDAPARAWSVCTRDPRQLDPAARPPFVSACFGDSGGPLLAGGLDIGAVSWGPACGSMRDPEIYANVVRGREFALARRPVWVPRVAGRPRITGAARVGATVSCTVRWLQRPVRASYDFFVGGLFKQGGTGARFRLPAGARGKTLSCSVGGSTAGGRYGSPLSPPVRVAG
jgi:hypothetical protein